MASMEDLEQDERVSKALDDYAGEHTAQEIPLPEVIDTVAGKAEAPVRAVKRNLFMRLDTGKVALTKDFRIRFVA